MIEITPFEPRFAEGVAAVIVPIQQAEFQLPVSLETQPDLLSITSFYQHGAGNFWVALTNADVIGTIALLDIGNHQAALRKMFVKSAYRGTEHGVAKHLLETLLLWSHAHGIEDIYLGTTTKFLAAHRFYEKNDFLEIARIQLPASFPIMTVDSKFYHRTLLTDVRD